MKQIRYLAAGLLALGLVAAALGASFFMSGAAASRPVKTFEDYMRDAEVYKEDNSYYMAIVSYEKALEEQEDNLDALKGLAETYGKKMDYDREMETRQKIAELQPDDLDNRLRIVEIMIRNKEFDAAKEETEAVLAQYESEEFSSLYEMMNIEAPAFNLSSGEYDEYQLLELMPREDGAIVRYTFDGSEPSIESPIWTEGTVISYPETEIRALAFSPLGFSSEETDLKITITKPVEVIVSSDSYYGRDEYILRSLADKHYGSEIYNYELAQVREAYCVGDYYPNREMDQVMFYSDHYTRYDYEYSDLGNYSLDFVYYTPFLKTLVFSYQEEVNLEPLSSLQYLENLSIFKCSVEDISPLESCKNLKKVALGWNNISDISPLSSLTSLESLGLWNNSIKDIGAVSGLHNLYYLDIANNEVSDISAVSELKDLTEVWINGNEIGNISPLDNCENLAVLMQAGNPVSEYGSIRDKAAQFYKTDLEQ